MPTLDKEIKDAESLLKTLQQKEPKLADDYEKLRDQYAAATASTSNDKRRHHVLSMLMREKTNGNIPGVLGRLVSLKFRSFAYNINYLFQGSLGAIDQKYDAAISTTCSALDLIVCDTFTTVQKCLKFIEENKLGRTSFIALDKQRHLKDKMQKIAT